MPRRPHRALARRSCARGRDGAARRVLRVARHAAPAARARAPRRPGHRARSGANAAMPRDVGAGRRRRLRPRPAVPALRRRRPGAPARGRSTPPARRRSSASSRTLWDIGLELGARRAHDRRVRRRDGRPTSRCARACSSIASSPARGAVPRVPRAASPQRMDVRAFYEAQVARAAAAAPEAPRRDRTTSSPTSRRARAGCATCRPCCGSRAPRASAARWRELARNGLMTHRRSARDRAAGALDRRHCASACTTSLGRREDRLVFDAAEPRSRKQLGLRRHAGQARERAADAALLPRGASSCARSTRSCCRTCTRGSIRRPPQPVADRRRLPARRRAPRRARRAPVRAPARRRCSTPSCALQRHRELKGMTRAHAARAVARAASHRRRVPRATPPTAQRSCRCSARAARLTARAAPDEPVRHPRPVPSGVRPHRRARCSTTSSTSTRWTSTS